MLLLETIVEEDICEEEDDVDPVAIVVSASHGGSLTQAILESAGVLVSERDLSTTVLSHLADMIADTWPDPETTDDLYELLETALDTCPVEVTSPTNTVGPSEQMTDDNDFDGGIDHDGVEPLPDAPPNVAFRCEFAQSGNRKVNGVKLHFFFGSGNVEVRSTCGATTRGDLCVMESLYALWMNDDTVYMMLSCPSMPRTLTNGRWRETREKPCLTPKIR